MSGPLKCEALILSVVMKIRFAKYHGTGNDFILIDDREESVHLTSLQISSLCHRRFGIGADGLILIRLRAGFDFEMVYYNADGNLGTMCGNGGRCAVHYAKELGLVSDRARFWASDGQHEAGLEGDSVTLTMSDVKTPAAGGEDLILNTGSPHYVKFVDEVDHVDVVGEGRTIRNSDRFRAEGINVNFVSFSNGQLKMRTYERGVEDETLSCGTGTVAAAIGASLKTSQDYGEEEWTVLAPGGTLTVSFTGAAESFRNVFLTGPAQFVFSGETEVK